MDFQVPALADVTLQWAQVGDHDFALYDNKNTLLACDAGTAVRLRDHVGYRDRDARVLGAAARAATTWSSTPTARARRAGWCCSCRRRRHRRRNVSCPIRAGRVAERCDAR